MSYKGRVIVVERAGIDSSLSGKGMHVALIFRSTGHSEIRNEFGGESVRTTSSTYILRGKDIVMLGDSYSIIHMDNQHDVGHKAVDRE